MKTALVLAVAVLANSLGNISLSKGMKQYGAAGPLGADWLLETGFHVFSNGWLMLGVLFLLVFLAAYLTALSWADLSFVLPATAPAYLLTAGLSKIFLHETISPARWAGTVLIVAGTCLITRTYSGSSSPRNAPKQGEADLTSAGTLREPSAGPGSEVAEGRAS